MSSPPAEGCEQYEVRELAAWLLVHSSDEGPRTQDLQI
jgi:hypothetical protein